MLYTHTYYDMNIIEIFRLEISHGINILFYT